MTDTEAAAVSRAIALFHEPEPRYSECRASTEWYGWRQEGDRTGWFCRSHREPEIAMRLLKAEKLTLECQGDTWIAGQRWFNGTVSMLANSAEADNPEDAIALAFCQANNVNVKEAE